MSFINCNLAYHVNKEGSSVKVLTCTDKNGSSSSFGEKTMEKKSLQNLSSAILCNDIIACYFPKYNFCRRKNTWCEYYFQLATNVKKL